MARVQKAADPLKEKRALAAWVGARLAETYPGAHCTLDFSNPLELYVATVLSAQCTDARVNQVTPGLFAELRRPEDWLALGQSELERRIQSTGFFRNKTKSILSGMARIAGDYGGRMPDRMEDLLTIPGIGRKTANVILGNAFGKAEGIVVDTHVARVSQRLGLTRQKDPVKIEQDLMQLFPRKEWTVLSHRMILHGRQICIARAPRCPVCPLRARCAYAAAAGLQGKVGASGKTAGAKTVAAKKRAAKKPAAKKQVAKESPVKKKAPAKKKARAKPPASISRRPAPSARGRNRADASAGSADGRPSPAPPRFRLRPRRRGPGRCA